MAFLSWCVIIALIGGVAHAQRPPNLARAGELSASSSATEFEGKYGPPRAVDGDTTSHWASADGYPLPQWFQVTFPEPQTVDTVLLDLFIQEGLYDPWREMEVSFSEGEPLRRELARAEDEVEFRFPARATTLVKVSILSTHTTSHYVGIDEIVVAYDPDRKWRPRPRVAGPQPQATIEILGRPEHPCVYVTREDLERAQRNLAQHEWARAIRDQIVAQAEEWLRESDEYWLEKLPGPGACYAYGFTGCPICGASWGTWGGARCSWDHPGHVTCANGHVLPDEGHPDNGEGYVGPDGRIHYFVGSYNAWVTEQFTLRALPALSQAYALTGDERYAARAAVLLDGLAAIYPESTSGSWDYPSTPPSGRFARPWYQVARTLVLYVDQYDLIFHSPALDTPSVREGRTKRENIEVNLLQDGAYYCYRHSFEGALHNGHADYMRGALAVGCLLGIPEYVRNAVDGPCSIYAMLDNNVDRDGRYYETALGYALHTRDLYLTFAEPLKNWRDEAHPEGIDLYSHPKFRHFYLLPDSVLDCAGHAPNFGDAAPDNRQVFPTEPRFSAADYRYAEHLYAGTRNPEDKTLFGALLRYLSQGEVNAQRGRAGLGAWLLFHAEDVPAGDTALPPEWERKLNQSWFLGQKGIGLLREGEGEGAQAALVRYGPSLNHGHRDDLGLIYYALGWQLTYEIGYGLGSTHTQVGWAHQTASHSLVVVNEKSQMETGRSGGSLHLFASVPGLQLLEASSEGSYESEGVTLYRRTVALVGGTTGNQGELRGTTGRQALLLSSPKFPLVPFSSPYLLDIFRVTGGQQHDYLLGVQTQEFTVQGVELGPEEEGSLAGPDIHWGELQGNDGDIKGYPNKPYWNPPPENGYGFFYGMRRGEPEGNWGVTWTLGGEKDVHFRLTLLGEPGTEAIVAKAPGLYPQHHRASFAIARRQGTNLQSTFVAVLEPWAGAPILKKVERLAVRSEGTPTLEPVGVKVTHADGVVDYLFSSGLKEPALVAETDLGSVRLSGAFAQVTAADGTIRKVTLHGADELRVGEWSFQTPARALTGTVAKVDDGKNVLHLNPSPETRGAVEGHWDGQWIYFESDGYSRNTAYRVEHLAATADGVTVHLGETSLVLGRGHVLDIPDETTLLTDVPHEYARSVVRRGNSGFFEGKLVTNGKGAATHLRAMEFGQPGKLVVESVEGFEVGDPLFYHDVQAGDRFVMPTTVHWGGERRGSLGN